MKTIEEWKAQFAAQRKESKILDLEMRIKMCLRRINSWAEKEADARMHTPDSHESIRACKKHRKQAESDLEWWKMQLELVKL